MSVVLGSMPLFCLAKESGTACILFPNPFENWPKGMSPEILARLENPPAKFEYTRLFFNPVTPNYNSTDWRGLGARFPGTYADEIGLVRHLQVLVFEPSRAVSVEIPIYTWRQVWDGQSAHVTSGNFILSGDQTLKGISVQVRSQELNISSRNPRFGQMTSSRTFFIGEPYSNVPATLKLTGANLQGGEFGVSLRCDSERNAVSIIVIDAKKLNSQPLVKEIILPTQETLLDAGIVEIKSATFMANLVPGSYLTLVTSSSIGALKLESGDSVIGPQPPDFDQMTWLPSADLVPPNVLLMIRGQPKKGTVY